MVGPYLTMQPSMEGRRAMEISSGTGKVVVCCIAFDQYDRYFGNYLYFLLRTFCDAEERLSLALEEIVDGI